MHDTSHYAECIDFLLKQKRVHMQRFYAIVALCIINCYIHVIIYGASDVTGGFMAFFFCIALVVMSLFSTAEMPKLCGISLGMTLFAMLVNWVNFVFGIPICIFFVITLIDSKKMAWVKEQPGYPYFNERFTEQEEKAFQEYHGTHDINDVMDSDMGDVSQSEDALPMTALTAEMPDVDSIIPDVASTPPAMTKEYLQQNVKAPAVDAQALTAPMAAAPMAAQAPAIAAAAPVITEAAAPVKAAKKHWNFKQMMREEEVSDVPKVDFEVNTDIPDPVWDIPDPVMDTSSILSSVPDIAGDIQDLPELPDIPQI